MDRLLVIGEDFGIVNPPYPEDRALTGAAGHRFADLAGVSFKVFVATTCRRNVVRDPRDWRDRDVVDQRVRWLRTMIREHRQAIVLGRRAAAALGLAGAEWGIWMVPNTTRIAVIPHTSGRNLLYNDRAVRERISAFLRPVFSEEYGRVRARIIGRR